MDGLSSIKPEIEAFVSRENRSHADPWLQQVEWVDTERTLKLYTREPPQGTACVYHTIDIIFKNTNLIQKYCVVVQW